MPHPFRTVFTLRAGSFSESDLRVRRIQGRERLSEPFDFTVDFTTASGELLELAELVGEKAALALKRPDGTERCVHGMVWRAEMTGAAAGKPSYRIRITPRLERMKLKVRRRVFQGQSVPEIVKQVLGEHGVEHRLSLSESYQPREYCVQYQEDDFSFVSRLLENEGIFYWFDHGAGSHTLVLADSVNGCTELPGETEVPYRVDEREGDTAKEEHLNWLERRYLGRPEKVQVGDYDFEQPQKELRGESQVEKRRLGIEVQEWPGGFKEQGEGKRRARLRLEELRADAETWSGKGICLRFFAGAKLEVTGHSHPDFNQKLLLVEVEHEGEQVEEAGAVEAIGHGYRNRFTAVEASVPLRPKRKTPRPMALPTTALVVGPKGEEVWVDQYGRVKVQFFWNREGKADESASCWMRAAQAWAGAGYGAQYAPRIGMEVLVKFFHHDPDQPFVAGAIYNGENRPPIRLPHDKSQSTVRTNTSPGGCGGNELKIEDLKGGEEVYLHAQKDEVIEVEKEKEQRVRGSEKLLVEKDRSIEVKGNQQLSVAKDDSTAIGVNQTLAVTGNRTTQVLGSQNETVGVAETVKVAKTRQVTVAAASAQTVGGAAALTIGAGYAVNVVGMQNTAVGGALMREVGGARVEVVGAAREERVAGDSSAKVGGDYASEVKGLVNISTEGSQQEVVSGSQQTRVDGSVRQSGREMRIEAPRITVVVGGRRAITLDQSGLVELHGTSITVNGTSIALKGAKIEKRAPAAARQEQVKVKKLEELMKAPARAELTLVDLDAAPIVNQPFRVELEGGTQRKGVTDKDGHAVMPLPEAGRFQVTFEGEPPTGWTPKLGGKAQGAFRVELGKAYSLTTGKNHLLDLAVRRNVMTVSYLFDGRANDEYPKYVLESEDGEYRQERGPKDDLLLGDKYLQLQFDGLLGGKKYKLTRWNDAKESRVIFEGAEYGRIIDQGRPATTEAVEIDHGSSVEKK